LRPGERLGQFVFIVPGAGIDQLVDIRTVDAFGIREDPHCSRFKVAAHFLGMGKRMGTHEILLDRFISHGSLVGSFGKHLGLQRQQIPEDAGQRHHHVDARPAQFIEGDQVSP
jgi:hypothetical protein